LLPQPIIAAAELRARQIGLGAERVLICADAITEDGYLAALAGSLGTIFHSLDETPRSACPLSNNELIQAASAGLMPLYYDGRLTWVIAPRNLTARRLADPRLRPPKWLQPFRLTSSGQLHRFVMRHTQRALGERATYGLRRAWPSFSNAPRKTGWGSKAAIALITLVDICLWTEPTFSIGIFGTMLCLIFLLTAAFRLWCAFTSKSPATRQHDIDDRSLPTYTIICALYREAAVAEKLVAAIRTLDYPGIMAQTPQANF
jgi:hypothetical protein